MKPFRFHFANLAKHGVSVREARECLSPGSLRYLKRVRRGVYLVIKLLASGRYLEVLYEDRPDETYVFHGMDARPQYVRLLKRRGKRR